MWLVRIGEVQRTAVLALEVLLLFQTTIVVTSRADVVVYVLPSHYILFKY